MCICISIRSMRFSSKCVFFILLSVGFSYSIFSYKSIARGGRHPNEPQIIRCACSIDIGIKLDFRNAFTFPINHIKCLRRRRGNKEKIKPTNSLATLNV